MSDGTKPLERGAKSTVKDAPGGDGDPDASIVRVGEGS
jgi:hypothetical protein